VTDALLTRNDRMEALSRVYLAAIAAQAGYVTSTPDLDRDSIDVMISAGDSMRPSIGVQLKATTRILAKAASASFPLPIKNYNDLRIETQTPRILVVLAMPAKEASWINYNVQRLILRRCAFWTSLRGMGTTTNAESVSVRLDLTQTLTVESLHILMDKSRKALPL